MTTTADIITVDEVNGLLEPLQDKYRQFRRAYREHDATDIDSNSFDFPEITDDLDGEMVEVAEGGDYTRASMVYGETSADYIKYGFEYTFSDEAVDDSVFDLEARGLERQMAEEERAMDGIAFNTLSGNLRSTVVGPDTSEGVLDTSLVNEARSTLFQDGYDMSNFELYVGAPGMQDVLDELGSRATDLGDSIQTGGELPGGSLNQGMLGTYAGIPTYATNTGDLGEGEAVLVDTGAYGWESRRWDTETQVYREDRSDETVVKIRNRLDFVVTDNNAAVKIEG